MIKLSQVGGWLAMFSVLAVLVVFVWAAENRSGDAPQKTAPSWNTYLRKYRNDDSVNQLVFVQCLEGSHAKVQLYTKDKAQHNAWTIALECAAFIGQNGLGKVREGDRKTPEGDFGILTSFGVKKNPGTTLEYTELTEDMYCCGEAEYYNQIIHSTETGHTCGADCEHLIDYSPHYNYAIFIDYNRECVVGKGSAIFFHCTGPNPYTGGCVAVSEKDMITILQACEPGARICIHAE